MIMRHTIDVRSRTPAPAVLAFMLASTCAPSGGAVAQDALTADPRAFRVMLENERVRVLEYRSRPGLGVCGQGMHSHPERVTVTLTAARVRVTAPDGTSAIREVPAGHTFYAPAETHAVENIGGAGTRIQIVELKGPGWSPSTGTD